MIRFLRRNLAPSLVLLVAVSAWVLPLARKFESKIALPLLSGVVETELKVAPRQQVPRIEPNELSEVLAVIASGTRDNESTVFLQAEAEIIAEGKQFRNISTPLVIRQEEGGGLDEDSCKTLCSCSASGFCGENPGRKRSAWSGSGVLGKSNVEVDVSGNVSHSLEGRAFPPLDTNDGVAISNYLEDREVRRAGVFGLTRTQGDNAEISLTRTHRFSDHQGRPLVIWSPELTGCTVLTVVSRKAVYMGHFWQPKAFERHAGQPAPDLQRNVLNLIRGSGPLYSAAGTSLEPELFGADTVEDANGERVVVQPFAAIMTPRYGTRTNNALYYPTEIGEIASVIQELIGVSPIIFGYHSLNAYNQGNGRRGAALFEYEWDADGEGNGDWRLWYEYAHESGRNLGMFPQGMNLPD